MHPVIALLTDFGHQDPYVGQMKGALLRMAPHARIVDLCHEVQPHNIVQASFLLQASHRHFPNECIFVNVVDPGVGSKRSILLARLEKKSYLAPDNGLLSFLLDEPASWWRIAADSSDVSRTFHGRDIFAGVAARLALGAMPESLGFPLSADKVVRSAMTQGTVQADAVDCVVLHVDRFGNCLLNLPIGKVPIRRRTWTLDDGRKVIEATTYAELAPSQIGLLEGSQGVMELAVNQDSCARLLEIVPGQTLRLTRTDTRRS